MGHNHVVSGNPKSTGIPQVDGLSTGPPDFWCHGEAFGGKRRQKWEKNDEIRPHVTTWSLDVVTWCWPDVVTFEP